MHSFETVSDTAGASPHPAPERFVPALISNLYRRLRSEEAAVHTESYLSSDEDDVAVVEPELLVMLKRRFGMSSFFIICRTGTLGWAIFLRHGACMGQEEDGNALRTAEKAAG